MIKGGVEAIELEIYVFQISVHCSLYIPERENLHIERINVGITITVKTEKDGFIR